MNPTRTQAGSSISGWQEELNKISSRYLTIGTIIAIILNPVFGIVDFFTLTAEWQHFMIIRCTVSVFLAGLLLQRTFIRNTPHWAGFVILTSIILQDAYIYSLTSLASIHQQSLSYMADFVGGSMVLLWNPLMAFLFVVTFILINLAFYGLNSSIPYQEFLSEGGLLVLAGVLFAMAMIVFRYHSVKAMVISKLELIRTNEWMAVQNEIIEEKSAALQQSNNRLKEFAYIVSHDLKAPLRGIRNIASWIREDCSETINQEGIDHLRLMEKQIIKMENLIRAVLEYSKAGISKSNSEWINLDDLINGVIEMVEVDNRTRFNIRTEAVQIKGTRIVISQVLQNLLSNSIKHNDKPMREVEIVVREDAGNFYFMVGDNGPGIDPRDQHRIFDLFQTLRENPDYENTGIGLAVSRKMVEEAGGELWLDSEPGRGSRFHFRLPKEA